MQTARMRALCKLSPLALGLPLLLGLQGGTGDPTGGKFTLEEALKGLPTKGTLYATLETSEGAITCELYEKQSPKTVANFVGLARGKRPFKDPKSGQWVTRPFYDGLVFHRVIPEFMIQGGDPLGNGTGDPGYEFEDETSNGLKFDKPGLLAMANHGPNTNGSQFFISERDTLTHLNDKHTIFGACEPIDTIKKIARVPRLERDRPQTPVVVKKVVIARSTKPKKKEKKAKPAAAAASDESEAPRKKKGKKETEKEKESGDKEPGTDKE